jgi:hypothetical protein
LIDDGSNSARVAHGGVEKSSGLSLGLIQWAITPAPDPQPLIVSKLEFDLMLGRAQQDLRHHWRNARDELRLRAPAATGKNLRYERAPLIDQVLIDGGHIGPCVMIDQASVGKETLQSASFLRATT